MGLPRRRLSLTLQPPTHRAEASPPARGSSSSPLPLHVPLDGLAGRTQTADLLHAAPSRPAVGIRYTGQTCPPRPEFFEDGSETPKQIDEGHLRRYLMKPKAVSGELWLVPSWYELNTI
jgi:hypothetical protein